MTARDEVEEPEEPVRIGDRYVRADGAKVTVTLVDGDDVEYAVLNERGEIWPMRGTLPLPETWTKAGSGPVPGQAKMFCVDHPMREVEPAQIYCPECIDQLAGVWAKYSPEEAANLTALLLNKNRTDP